MDPVTLKNFRDAHVMQHRPKRNFSNTARLKVAGSTHRSFMYWGKPMPDLATISPAKLRVWNSEAWAGSVTLTVQRLSGKWAGSRIHWDNQPGVTGATVQVVKSGAAKNTMWEFDIGPLMQSVADGASWFGVRIVATGASVKNIYSAQAKESQYRPTVIIGWSDNPAPPEDLNPDDDLSVSVSHPTLRYEFIDVSGGTQLTAHQIQFSATEDFAVVAHDTGWLATDVPELDTSTTAWAGLADAASTWWRVRTRDDFNLESEWSEAALFNRVTKGTLTSSTLGNFVDGGGNTIYYVEDTTPPIIWDLAGRTQSTYRAIIERVLDPDPALFDTGRLSGTVNSIDTGTKKILPNKVEEYRLILYIRDDVDRAETPGDPIIYQYIQEFIYQPSAAVTAPADLTVNWVRPWPWMDLTWTRPTPPDSFTVFRDNEVVEANLDPADLLVIGTTYAYQDKLASPRQNHTWTVVANVNGVDSLPSNAVVDKLSPGFSWMMESDGENPIAIVKSAEEPTPAVDATSMSFQEVHQPIGGSSPVLVTQFISGFEGHVDGVLSDGVVQGLTGRTMRNRFKVWKKNPGTELILYMVDEVMLVVPYNLVYRPRAKSGGQVLYDISFDFFQVDF